MKHKSIQLLSILLLTVLYQTGYSQSHVLSGQVVSTANQQPLQGVTVRVSGIPNGRVTDENGTFSFENLPNGQYTLSFSYLGYESSRINITLPSSNSGNLAVALNLSTNQLQAVEIIGRKEQTYKNTSSSQPSRHIGISICRAKKY